VPRLVHLRGLSVLCLLACCGCSSHREATVEVPPPPAIEPETPAAEPPVPAPDQDKEQVATVQPQHDAEPSFPKNAKPIFTETGLASWYGPPYNKRRGSNGEIYDMNAMTAAHRTLPLGSIVRVTNEQTGHSAIVRITDRGPFIEGRVLDLSLAAAKKTDVWRAGVAKVRLDVLDTPASLDHGGKWAVQIGKFDKEKPANKLADHLQHRYQTAKVLCFSGPMGDWWVRVRVQDDEKKRAEEVARNTDPKEAAVFLVRLD